MDQNDGVALTSIAHPRLPWHKRVWWFVWQRWFAPRLNEDSLETIEIEVPEIKEILGISGGYADPSPRDPRTGLPIGSLADEYGWIMAFPPWERLIITDKDPIEIIVIGYEGPENESRPVIVMLKRSASDEKFPNALLWQASFNRYEKQSDFVPLFANDPPLVEDAGIIVEQMAAQNYSEIHGTMSLWDAQRRDSTLTLLYVSAYNEQRAEA